MPPVDWDECARRLDECEKLEARVRSLEGALRRRAQRARDEGDVGTVVRVRDAAHEANRLKAERAEVARELQADLERAQTAQTPANLAALAARLDESAEKSRAIAELYEPLVEWDAEPS